MAAAFTDRELMGIVSGKKFPMGTVSRFASMMKNELLSGGGDYTYWPKKSREGKPKKSYNWAELQRYSSDKLLKLEAQYNRNMLENADDDYPQWMRDARAAQSQPRTKAKNVKSGVDKQFGNILYNANHDTRKRKVDYSQFNEVPADHPLAPFVGCINQHVKGTPELDGPLSKARRTTKALGYSAFIKHNSLEDTKAEMSRFTRKYWPKMREDYSIFLSSPDYADFVRVDPKSGRTVVKAGNPKRYKNENFFAAFWEWAISPDDEEDEEGDDEEDDEE